LDIKYIQKQFQGSNRDELKRLDTFSRLRVYLIDLYKETQKIDEHSKFISWKDTKRYKVLQGYEDGMPNNSAAVAQFFDGMRLMRTQGRQYLRFRLNSRNEAKMESALTEWSRLYNHSFYRCIIQEEHLTAIGWLLYSSQYTNTQQLSKYLQNETGFEWGFKLGSITKSDEKEDGKAVLWKNWLKAMVVHVPSHKAEVAVTKISILLQAKKIDKNQTPLFYQRYLFIQQESTMVDVNSRLQCKHILSRQRSHLASIKSKLMLSIDADMDRRIHTKEGGILSLREMILAMNNRQDGDTWDPLPLFHSIDFCPDTSKVWVGNSMGPGGPGHILTYYNVMEAEALQMIRGMGIFLGTIYGYDNVVEFFSRDHWQSLEGWKFSRKKWLFITPESRQMNDNLKLDSNKLMVRMTQQQFNQSESTKTKPIQPKSEQNSEQLLSLNNKVSTESTSSDVHNDHSVDKEIKNAFRKNEVRLMKKMVDDDLDSIDNAADDEVAKIHNIDINDGSSTASSLTNNTAERPGQKIPFQLRHSPDNTEGSISTLSSLDSITSSIHSITRDKLESLFEEGMTQKQRKQQADQYTYQQLRKVMIEKNKLYKSLFPEEEKENISIGSDRKEQFEEEKLLSDVDQESKSNDREFFKHNSESASSKSSGEISVTAYIKFSNQDVTTLSDDDPPITGTKSKRVRLKNISYEDSSDDSAGKEQ
jgi:hypothetical protein